MHKDNRGNTPKPKFPPYADQFKIRMQMALDNAANLKNLNKKNKR